MSAPTDSVQQSPPLKTRVLRFVLAVLGLILFVYLGQLPIRHIPALNHYATQADKYGIHPGALYYTDVPVTFDSAQRIRAAVESVDRRHRLEREER